MDRRIRSIALGSFLFCAPSAWAGTFTQSLFSDDASSGVNAALPHTAVIDFQGPGNRSVNGLTFASTGGNGNFYTLTGAGTPFTGNTNSVAGNMNGLLTDFIYGSTSGASVLTLGGLTPGVQYTTTWYNAGFGAVGGRQMTIIPSDTNVPFPFDENFSGDKNGNLLRYTLTATAPFITYTFNAASGDNTYHYYALTNSGSLPSHAVTAVSPVITDAVASGAGSFSPFTVSNTDLLQTSLASFSSTGTFNLENTGGIPALANGSFNITGVAQNNPDLATGQSNASITVNLNLATNPLGYDISSIVGYGGWNDGGRDRQLYNIYVSFVGDPTFAFIGGVDHDINNTQTVPSASRAVFTLGTPLSNVDSIRIDFPAGQENGYAGYGEFDVIGTGSVPEPSSALLMVSALSATCAFRRSRRPFGAR